MEYEYKENKASIFEWFQLRNIKRPPSCPDDRFPWLFISICSFYQEPETPS